MINPALHENCVDYGSERCPCVLSTLNECLVCSHLQGNDLCDCDWGSYCVYINYLHDRKAVPCPAEGPAGPLRVISMDPYGHHVFFSVPKWVAQSARPLHFIYLKGDREDKDQVSAVTLNTYPAHGVLAAAVCSRPEAAAAPYPALPSLSPGRTGGPALSGLRHLAGIRGKRLLLMAGGFSQLLVGTLINSYISSTNQMTLYLENDFPSITKKLERLKVNLLLAANGDFPADIPKKAPVDAVISLGGENTHQRAAEIRRLSGSEVPHLTLNVRES